MTHTVTRLVHGTLVTNLGLTTLVRCLTQFMSRKGILKSFISDNTNTTKVK